MSPKLLIEQVIVVVAMSDEIETLVAVHPLPDGVQDAVLNREELGEALGVSLNTITSWMNAGMPVQAEGRNGKPYELRLSHCYAWSEARRREEEARSSAAREAITAMRLAMVGGKSGDSIEALDPKQRRDILTAQIAHEQLESARNRLLRRDDVKELLDTLMGLIRDGLDVTPDRIERMAPTLPPKAVNALVDCCDGIADDVARRISAYWEARPERGAQYMRQDMFDA